MADAARLLDTMRAMREPPAPPPITPVLVMLAIGCAVALAMLVVAWRVRRRQAALRGAATALLAESRRLAPAERLAAQARLLRRLVRNCLGEAAAREQGEAWLARLDALFDTSFFTQGAGVAYGEALYRRAGKTDVEALDRSLLGLFAKLRPAGARG